MINKIPENGADPVLRRSPGLYRCFIYALISCKKHLPNPGAQGGSFHSGAVAHSMIACDDLHFFVQHVIGSVRNPEKIEAGG